MSIKRYDNLKKKLSQTKSVSSQKIFYKVRVNRSFSWQFFNLDWGNTQEYANSKHEIFSLICSVIIINMSLAKGKFLKLSEAKLIYIILVVAQICYLVFHNNLYGTINALELNVQDSFKAVCNESSEKRQKAILLTN